MYVRTFEAETLDDALKNIKQELGPDAIILKTVTNKGLKGAFKKSKIEITAAISEKNYKDKMQVDHVLNDEQRQEFYQGPSSHISNMIDQHAKTNGVGQAPAGYGKIGLNRTVTDLDSSDSTVSKVATGPSLEDFLKGSDNPVAALVQGQDLDQEFDVSDDSSLDHQLGFQTAMPGTPMADAEVAESRGAISTVDGQMLEGERRRIDQLEQKLLSLQQDLTGIEQRAPMGVYQLQTTLRSLDISERYIKTLTEKILFNLSEDEVADPEMTFEYALMDMAEQIKVAMPLFSSVNLEQDSCVTMLLSGVGAGQSSTLMKLGALKREESVVIKYCTQGEQQKTFAAKLFDIQVIHVATQAEVMLECRKAVDSGKSVFIDYENGKSEYNDVKKFVNGLKRSFGQVEVLVCLSAIHSELYNRQIVATNRSLADGMVISHLDLCLNFGSLFNVAYENSSLPFKFYGTGTVVPDDLEAASNERILAGIFNIK
jgi:flagellar biosynthesis protein FlhF